MELLRMEHVTICYDGEPVVQDVSLELEQGEILGIVGESGSGKSTLIKAIMGLLGTEGCVTEGDIWYKGENLTEMSAKKLRRFLGPEIGMIFQDCKAALCPVRKVGVQICEAVRAHEKLSRKEIKQRATEIMQKIGLTDTERIWNSYPFELSGGMNQRVGICIAMVLKPELLLADEATTALDVTVQKQVVKELLMMKEDYGTSMIVVTHNIGVVRAMADKVLVLKDGKIRDYGDTDKVLKHSKDIYTRKLMDSVLRLKIDKDYYGRNYFTGEKSEKNIYIWKEQSCSCG